jgi:hypothetical protein
MQQQEHVIMHDLHMLLFPCASSIDSIYGLRGVALTRNTPMQSIKSIYLSLQYFNTIFFA